MAPFAYSQPPYGYSELDEYEKGIKSDMQRMLKENNERMLRAISEQFSWFVMENRKKRSLA